MKKIKLYIPANGAKGGQPLSPILGQNHIALNQFCLDFNSLSSHIVNDIELPVKVLKDSTGYKIFISHPTIYALTASLNSFQDLFLIVENFLKKEGKKIDRAILAKVLLSNCVNLGITLDEDLRYDL